MARNQIAIPAYRSLVNDPCDEIWPLIFGLVSNETPNTFLGGVQALEVE